MIKELISKGNQIVNIESSTLGLLLIFAIAAGSFCTDFAYYVFKYIIKIFRSKKYDKTINND